MKFHKELAFLLESEKLSQVVNERQKLSEHELHDIRRIYPNIPNDFINYLKEIGAGNIGKSQFKITNTLYDFSDIGLDEIYNIPKNIKFFGDNFSGDFAGFDVSQIKDEVIEFWHDSNQLYHTKKTFREYIREKILLE